MGNKRVFVELKLSPSMKIHNVFHLNLFQKTSTDLFTNQVNKLPLPVIINNTKEWKIEDIFNAKSYRSKL